MGKIKGSKSIGDLSDEDGKALARLKEALAARKPGQEIIIYCGCCKTDGCPYVLRGLHELAKLGVRDARAIDFDDFGPDWEEKGYPMDK